MWLEILAVTAVAVVAFWMGRQSSLSRSAAGETMLHAAQAVQGSADLLFESARRERQLEEKIANLTTQVQQQTDSSLTAALALEKLDSNVYLLLEAMSSRGMVKKASPRQAGEAATTSPPPLMPLERIPVAPSPSTTTSSAPPTVTG